MSDMKRGCSDGTDPFGLNQKAVTVMAEIGIDISGNTSDSFSRNVGWYFDFVISFCGDSQEMCPAFFRGQVPAHAVR